MSDSPKRGRPAGSHHLSATFANLAMRQVRVIPGSKANGKSTVGISLPAGWAEKLGLLPGSVVMLSLSGKEIRIYPVNEKDLLESLQATIGSDP